MFTRKELLTRKAEVDHLDRDVVDYHSRLLELNNDIYVYNAIKPFWRRRVGHLAQS